MARIVPQRHEYFAMPQPARQHVVLNNGDPARVAVLVAKPFENPLRGMPLLSRPTFIRRQDPVDDPGKRIQLRTRRRPAPPVSGRDRKRQHLGYRPRVNPKPPRRFPPAQTLDLNRITNPRIKLHALHPPAPAASDKGYLLPEFYSGATGLTGRFSEGFLLRRLHTTNENILGPNENNHCREKEEKAYHRSPACATVQRRTDQTNATNQAACPVGQSTSYVSPVEFPAVKPHKAPFWKAVLGIGEVGIRARKYRRRCLKAMVMLA